MFWGMKLGVTSEEFNKDTNILLLNTLMEEQKGIVDMGGTMRLGSYPCILEENSVAASVYGETSIK